MMRPCQVVFHLIYEDSSCRNEYKIAKRSFILLVSIVKVCDMGSMPTTTFLSEPMQKLTSNNLNIFPILWSLPFFVVVVVEDTT